MAKERILAQNDAFISRNFGYKNYGSLPYLVAGGTSMDRECDNDSNITLLQFDLSAYGINSNIRAADLYIYVNSIIGNKCGDIQLAVYKVCGTYYRTLVTWNTSPAVQFSGLTVTVPGMTSGAYIKFNIFRFLNEWLIDGGEAFNIAIGQCDSDGLIIFSSTRGDYKPFIEITKPD